jgi:WD40 repeat protein
VRYSGRREGVFVVLLALLAGCAAGGPSSSEPTETGSVDLGPVRSVGAEPAAVYGHGRGIAAYADADGTLVTVTTTGLHRSDPDSGVVRALTRFEPGIRPERAVLSLDGGEVAVLVGDSTSVLAYETDGGALTRSWAAPDGVTVYDVWFEPTGDRLVIETSAGPVLVGTGDVDRGDGDAVVSQPTGQLGVLPDGSVIGAIVDSAELVLVGPTSSERRPIDLGEGERAEDVRVSPDGAWIGVTVPSSDDELEQVHRVALLDASLAVVGSIETGLRLERRTWTLANDRLVVAHDTEVTAWSTDGEELGRAETGPVADVFPFGDEVVILGRDGSIARWDGESAPVPLAAGAVTLVFGSVDADMATVTTVDLFGRVHVRSLDDGTQLRTEEAFAVGALTSLALSADGSTIAVGSTAGDVAVLGTDLLPQQMVSAAPYGSHVDAVAFDPGTGELVTGLAERLGSEAFDDTVTAWSAEYTERFRALGDAEDTPGCAFFNAELRFDPSGALLVAASHDFGVAVIDDRRLRVHDGRLEARRHPRRRRGRRLGCRRACAVGLLSAGATGGQRPRDLARDGSHGGRRPHRGALGARHHLGADGPRAGRGGHAIACDRRVPGRCARRCPTAGRGHRPVVDPFGITGRCGARPQRPRDVARVRCRRHASVQRVRGRYGSELGGRDRWLTSSVDGPGSGDTDCIV